MSSTWRAKASIPPSALAANRTLTARPTRSPTVGKEADSHRALSERGRRRTGAQGSGLRMR
jgi:hypothetical protein